MAYQSPIARSKPKERCSSIVPAAVRRKFGSAAGPIFPACRHIQAAAGTTHSAQADLAGKEHIDSEAISEAIHYRSLDKELWR